MPNRSPAAAELIASLPVKPPDNKCNARTPSGYCRHNAGQRTDHVGEGRCWLHGGRAGRLLESGLYSRKLRSKIKDEFERVCEDPQFMELYSELGLLKLALQDFLGQIAERMEDGNDNVWIGMNKHGEDVISPEAELLMKFSRQISSLMKTIMELEEKSKHTLSLRQIMEFVQQFKHIMMSTCGLCPVRESISRKLSAIKIEPIKTN